MTDLEITRLCAEAMGFHHWGENEVRINWPAPRSKPGYCKYNPLHDDAQAMALVKKLQLFIEPRRQYLDWHVYGHGDCEAEAQDLNRAICECVAKMQREKANG